MWNSNRKLNMHEPSVFVIRVQGHLGEDWTEFFDVRIISVYRDQAGHAITILKTEPIDQAALVGLINYMNALGMPLVSVTCTEEE